MLPNHAYLHFTPAKNNGTAVVSVHKETDDDTFDILAEFLDTNFKRIGKSHQWALRADEAHELCAEVDKLLEDVDNEEDESDDELIQEAIARRFKTSSEQKVDDREHVDDSEDEHIIGLSRRLRHIYAKLKAQQTMIDELMSRIEYLETR